ncbi:MAG: hypothetical protein J6M18_02365 [Actinomycetaceae bacterium]|nr:hypothetical protein [Actinomycetaceae bacterium]
MEEKGFHLPRFETQDTLWNFVPSSHKVNSSIDQPVAHVQLENVPLHLDHIYDYEIPEGYGAMACVGARVVVPFGHRDMNGFIVERDSHTSNGGTLKQIKKIFSDIPVLTPSIFHLSRIISEKYLCGVSSCLRLAIPSRHARAEKDFLNTAHTVPHLDNASDPYRHVWNAYNGGQGLLQDLEEGKQRYAAVVSLPGEAGGVHAIASLVRSVRMQGKSVLIIMPTHRACERMAKSLRFLLKENVGIMLSQYSHEERYKTFLGILHGYTRIIVGTRHAVWAPVQDLGLCILFDDASEHLYEQHAPYVHVRDVLMVRAENEKASFITMSSYISEESMYLMQKHKGDIIHAHPSGVVQYVPHVSIAQQWSDVHQSSRLPEAVFRLVRQSIEKGPILFLVPRSGYIPVVACQSCKKIVTCCVCGGKVTLQAAGHIQCSRCSYLESSWSCSQCQSTHLRAVHIGSARTAEEIGKAFPHLPVVISGGQTDYGIIDTLDNSPRIVVATPGAEPYVPQGFSSAVILDVRFLMGQGFGSEIGFLRKISRVIARVRSRREGGHVLLVGGVDEGLVRLIHEWKLPDITSLLLEERIELRLPPTAWWASLEGNIKHIKYIFSHVKHLLDKYEHVDSIASYTSAREHSIYISKLCEILGPQTKEEHTKDESLFFIRSSWKYSSYVSEAFLEALRECQANYKDSRVKMIVDPQMS